MSPAHSRIIRLIWLDIGCPADASTKVQHLWVNNESWEALRERLLVLVLGVLGEGWGAGGPEEGGHADFALDVHGLYVLGNC